MSELYLGRLAFEPKPYTRLEPMALHEEGRWRIYGDWTKALPSEGRVFAPNLAGFLKDDLLTFGVEPNARSSNRPDKFLLASYDRVREVLDFRAVGAEAARRQLVEEGLPSMLRATDGVVAAIGDGTCVVLTLGRHPTKNGVVADTHGLERLPTYHFDDRLFEGQRIGNRWIEVPGVTVGRRKGQVNWCRDADFLETVLKRLRKAVPHGPGSISRSQIPQLVAYFARADLLPSTGDDLVPMLERLKALSPQVIANANTLADLVATVAAFEPVEQRLRAETDARRAELQHELRVELEAKIRAELQHDMQGLEATRTALQAEVSELSSSAARLREEASEHKTSVMRARSAIIDEISTVLRSFGDVPPEGDPTVDALSERLGAVLKERRSSFRELTKPSSPWAALTLERAPSGDWATVISTLESVAAHHGYDAEDVFLADIGARSGDIVVLPEGHVAFAVAYAEAIAGGNLTRHVLDPSVLNVDDLWAKPGNSQSTAFSKAWSAARLDPGRFFVVLLDGLHRTPLDLWMPSLVDILDSRARPSNLLVLATLGRSFVDDARIWKHLDRSVTAIEPTFTSDDAGLLMEVMGREPKGRSFDPTTMPLPPKETSLDVVDRARGLTSHRDRHRLLRLYRSAWPLASKLNPLERAWSIVSVGNETVDAVHPRTKAGFAWLRATLENRP